MMKRLPILLLFTLFSILPLPAQKSAPDGKVADQKRIVERLERQIAQGEKELAGIKKDRSSAEQRARRLARQIESRNDLLAASEDRLRDLSAEAERTDSLAGSLNAALLQSRARYAEMVREAYRNYKQNNYLTYIFASKSFSDIARRLANLREVAALRERQIRTIDSLERRTTAERERLALQRRELDSVHRSLEGQKQRLQRDSEAARASIRQLSKKEQTALKRKVEQEQQLDAAIAELRKLTKGNKEGAGFSARTSNLRLPVAGGSVKRYRGNMAEISGPRGAQVISIYEGKVVDVKRNRITNKYDVYVAHGEYISSYANLSSVCVAKGDKVARNGALGVIGSSVDVLTMKSEYKLVFGIYPPSAGQKLSAADCFRK